MKPPPFQYYAPKTREEALSLLAQHGYEAKILAGGQSLVPSMNFRLAQPGILIDLNGIDDLFGIHATEDGGLRIAAMTRQRDVERSTLVQSRAPLVYEAMPYIAHPQIRNRGTFGGSLAHADPAAELPALMLALGAQMSVERATDDGRRTTDDGQSIQNRIVPVEEFFLGLFTTALEPEEMLVEMLIPPLPPRTGTAFEEVSRRTGDYAMVGACATVRLAEDGTVADSKLVYFAIGEGPVLATSVSEVLQGVAPTEEAIRAAAEAVDAEIDPDTDIHATAAYRRHLAQVLARRVLGRAVERAKAE
ncbi:MAG TPA: xanthine dehydrogenase family protein subunit M [Chloroflexia bacterium]|nr:xanthine dehydrogenase family protein subunit M [Chloroflexia bacterium]